jgi:hypothetical protein
MRRSLFCLAAAAAAAGGCGSSAPAAPEWADAPASIETYEGRAVTVPFAFRASDPAAVRVVASGEGLEVEPAIGSLRVRAVYGASPTTLRVDLTEGGKTTTVSVAVRAHRLGWKPMTWPAGQGPQPLEHGVFFLDENAGAAFLLHGSGYSPQWKPVAETWRFDVKTGTWSPWTPAGDVPEPAAAARGATVRARNVGFVHGGYTGYMGTEKSQGDLFRVDLASGAFKKLASTGAPGPRQLHALAYDETSDRLVVFGGFGESGVLDDAWLVKVDGDAATWTSAGGKGPSPRYGGFYAVDAASRRFVVWSGAQTPAGRDQVNAAQDAWALDLETSTWSKLEPAGDAPKGRRNGCTMHDPLGRRLFVFGGTSDGRTSEKGLFVLDLEPGREAWTKLDLPGQPPERSSGFGFSLSDGRVACGFGNDNDAFADVNWIGYFD